MYFLRYQAQNHGPYALDQIRSMWASGIITADAMYWVQAESAWKPIAELLDEKRHERTSTPEPDPVKHQPGAATAPAVPPRTHTTNTEPLRYAGFWLRTGAFLLDLGVFLPLGVLTTWCDSQFRLFSAFYLVPGILLAQFYYVYLVQRFGGTPGKLKLGLRILLTNGKPVGYFDAFLRHLPMFILGLLGAIAIVNPLLQLSDAAYHSLSFMERASLRIQLAPSWYKPFLLIQNIWFWSEVIVLFTNRKRQTLHDFFADTIVVRISPAAACEPKGGDTDAPSSEDEPETASNAAGESSTSPVRSPLFRRVGRFAAFVVVGFCAFAGGALCRPLFPRTGLASMLGQILGGAVGGGLGGLVIAIVVEMFRHPFWRRNTEEDQSEKSEAVKAPEQVQSEPAVPSPSAESPPIAEADSQRTTETPASPPVPPPASWSWKLTFGVVLAIGVVIFIVVQFATERRTMLKELFGMVASEDTVASTSDYKAAKAAERKSDHPAMLRHARALVEQHPTSGLALRCLADVLDYTEAHPEAVATLKKAIALDSDDVVAWNDLAVVYYHMKWTSDADAAFQKALKLAEKEPKPWADFGAFCFSQGRKDEAEKATEHAARLLEQAPFNTHHGELDESGAWVSVGKNYLDLEKPLLAEQMFKRATELDPQNVSVWHALGCAFYSQEKNDLALSAFLSATKLAPKNSVGWDMLALCYSAKGDKESELAAYRQAVAADPKDFVGWKGLGYYYHDQGVYLDAIDCWEKALNIEPDDRTTLVRLAGEYEKAGRLDDAIAAYEKMVKLNNSVSALSLLAGAYDKKGRLQEAIHTYREVVRSNPPDSTHWYWAGDYFWRMGITDEAIAAFEKFASLENRSSMERSNAILTIAYAYGLAGKNADAKRLYDNAASINGENIQERANERLNYLRTALREKVQQQPTREPESVRQPRLEGAR